MREGFHRRDDWRKDIYHLRRFIGLISMLCAAGCEPDISPSRNTEGLQDLQPVSGTVSYQGKPTPGAVVLFHPAAEPDAMTPRIAGTVDEDGAFEMSTTVSAGTLPGVQPGKYLITITWAVPINPDDKDSDMGPDLLPEKYKDHTTSNLQVEVQEGGAELSPFDLND